MVEYGTDPDVSLGSVFAAGQVHIECSGTTGILPYKPVCNFVRNVMQRLTTTGIVIQGSIQQGIEEKTDKIKKPAENDRTAQLSSWNLMEQHARTRTHEKTRTDTWQKAMTKAGIEYSTSTIRRCKSTRACTSESWLCCSAYK
eukprot:scaffold6030_cov199-Amphora_coffeaeformis.AAC.1